MVEPIQQSSLLLVEGDDDFVFFLAYLKYLGFAERIRIIDIEGVDKLLSTLETLPLVSGFDNVQRIGIVRDADSNAKSAFDSACSALKKTNFAIPREPIKPSGGTPDTSILVLPPSPTMRSNRALEDLLLTVLSDDPVMTCVEDYFKCIVEKGIAIKPEPLPKAELQVFMAAYFQSFLRTYTEGKNVDTKAKRSDRKRKLDADLYQMSWWTWDHPAFADVRAFLTQLASA
jgi:hypothetical protein